MKTSDPAERGATEIRDHYRRPAVVESYDARRFREPLGALLHARQTAALRVLLRAERPSRVAELAAGTGRLASAISGDLVAPCLLVDSSLPMLAQSRIQLDTPRTSWRRVQGDVFHLPLAGGALDLVYCFRFIRHLELADRRRCYREIHRVLRPGGWFVLDAVNETVSAPLRAEAAPGEYTLQDALFRPDTLRAELTAAGYGVVAMHGVQFHYALLRRIQILLAPRSRRLAGWCMKAVERVGGGEPLEWVVTCRSV